jgi:uncharacterized protein
MISAPEREAIYQLQQKDRWEFKRDSNGYFWLRIASNGEVVGVSHRAFSQLPDCEANARAVGYANEFSVPRTAVWEFATDARSQHIWRLLDTKGVVINRSHQGFESKTEAEKNAVRHGYGLVSSVDQVVDEQFCGTHECTDVTCGVPNRKLRWLIMAICAVFVLIALVQLVPKYLGGSRVNDVNTTVVFADLEQTDMDYACISQIHSTQAIAPQILDEAVQFLPEQLVTKAELAKALLGITDNGPLACAPTSQELPGEKWADAYLHCAKAKQWRVFVDADADYNQFATKQDLAYSILDARNLTVDEALQSGILRSLGNFTPTDTFTRRDLARVLCAASDTK